MSNSKYSEKSPAPIIESELYKILWELHNHVDKADVMDNLIKELEDIPRITNEKSIDFCKSYIILVVEKYIKGRDDREMLLASYGLLKGLEFKPGKLYRRMRIYRNNAQNYNTFCQNTLELENDSFSTTYRDELRRITIKLEEELTNAKNEGHGKLGLLSEVPVKLELPEPLYLSNIPPSTVDVWKGGILEWWHNGIDKFKLYIPDKGFSPEAKKDILEIIVELNSIIGIILLVFTLDKQVKPSPKDTNLSNAQTGRYVEEEPQQINVPDITQSSNGELQNNEQGNDNGNVTSF